MTQSEQLYLELLRAGLWNRPARVASPIHVKDILSLAAQQSTLPTVYAALLAIPGIKIPEKLAEQMQSGIDRCASSHRVANRVIAMTASSLEAEGIGCVLLKGQGVASHYPVPELRQPGDIDLYIRPEDFEKACGIIEKMYGEKSEEDSDKHRCYHVGGTLYLELHKYTEVLHPKRINRIYQAISDEGTGPKAVVRDINGAEIRTPEDTFNAFYIFNHLWEHTRSMGIGLRQVCDWTVFLHTHSDTIDRDSLGKWLDSLHLKTVWQVFGSAAAELLGIVPEEVPFYDARKEKRGHRLAEFILGQGDNSEFKHGRGDAGKLKHKAGSLAFIFSRFSRMVRIFPKVAFYKTIADILQGAGKIFHIFVS